MLEFSPLDYAALTWFGACWFGFTVFADHSRLQKHGIVAAMDHQRRRWMTEMLGRELRMLDTQIIGNLLTGIGFFASTAILAVGGLVAILGAVEQAIGALEALPFAVPTGRGQWEIKVLFLITIFVYAFFKFAWAFRLSNYCSILIGAAPSHPVEETVAADYVERAATVIGLAARHLNRGLRAYFFALAALGWFVHPLLFALASALVVGVLYRREFRSRALRAVTGQINENGAAPKGET